MIKIDETWSLNKLSNCYQLVKKVISSKGKNEGKEISISKGYYAHIDEALKGYLQKSLEPKEDIKELFSQIENIKNNIKNLENLK